MSIMGWVLLGLLAGLIVRVLIPENAPGGTTRSVLLGVGGALVGALLASLVGLHGSDTPVTFLALTLAAVVLLRSTVRLATRVASSLLALGLDAVLACQSAPGGIVR